MHSTQEIRPKPRTIEVVSLDRTENPSKNFIIILIRKITRNKSIFKIRFKNAII